MEKDEEKTYSAKKPNYFTKKEIKRSMHNFYIQRKLLTRMKRAQEEIHKSMLEGGCVPNKFIRTNKL